MLALTVCVGSGKALCFKSELSCTGEEERIICNTEGTDLKEVGAEYETFILTSGGILYLLPGISGVS